jgi:hypothetical protein
MTEPIRKLLEALGDLLDGLAAPPPQPIPVRVKTQAPPRR